MRTLLFWHVQILNKQAAVMEADDCSVIFASPPGVAKHGHQAPKPAHQVPGCNDLGLSRLLQGVQVRICGGGPHPHLGGDVVLAPVTFIFQGSIEAAVTGFVSCRIPYQPI